MQDARKILLADPNEDSEDGADPRDARDAVAVASGLDHW